MKKVIIFDFDRTIGTLVADWTAWRRDIKDLILEFEPDSDIKIESIKHANQNGLINKYGSEFREKLNLINEHSEANLVTDFYINNGILDFIANTEKELYCWSSNSKKTLEKYLFEMNILNKFEKIVSRDDTYLLKPDKEGFELIYDNKIPKEGYLFVGDSKVDEVAAEKSGIDFMHVDAFDPRV